MPKGMARPKPWYGPFWADPQLASLGTALRVNFHRLAQHDEGTARPTSKWHGPVYTPMLGCSNFIIYHLMVSFVYSQNLFLRSFVQLY